LQNHPEVDKSLATGGENSYYVSDVTDAARMTAQRIFGRKLELIQVDVEGN